MGLRLQALSHLLLTGMLANRLWPKTPAIANPGSLNRSNDLVVSDQVRYTPAVMAAKVWKVADILERHYGSPGPPVTVDPFEMFLLESVAYLATDEKRLSVFEVLKKRVGTRPVDILAASESEILEITKLGGINAEGRAGRIRDSALMTLREFDGDLNNALHLPLKQALKSLMRYPSIGEPGAEKMLLFSRTAPILALDSNGLRVLLRLGYGTEAKSYSTTYRSVKEAIRNEIKEDFTWLISTHQLLQQHGRELCRRTTPKCSECPVSKLCDYYQNGVRP